MCFCDLLLFTNWVALKLSIATLTKHPKSSGIKQQAVYSAHNLCSLGV